MTAALRARLRPCLDIVDMIAPGAAVQPAQRSGAARSHLLQRGQRQAEMEGGLLGGEKWAGLARCLRAPGGVVHRLVPLERPRTCATFTRGSGRQGTPRGGSTTDTHQNQTGRASVRESV